MKIDFFVCQKSYRANLIFPESRVLILSKNKKYLQISKVDISSINNIL